MEEILNGFGEAVLAIIVGGSIIGMLWMVLSVASGF